MSHIVVLGAGIGGMPCAYELKSVLGSYHKITLINERDYFQFTPSNPWVAVGKRERNAITFKIRPYLEKKQIDFIDKRVDKIEAENNQLIFSDGATLSYDYLVVTTGPSLAFDEVEGSGPAAHTQSICTTAHAEQTYKAYEKLLSKGSGHIVIGAMPSASCFGPAYEFAFILDSEMRRKKIRHKFKMTYVTSEPYIGHLGLGGVGDSKGLLESELRSHHINWIVNAQTTRVEEGVMWIDELDEKGEKTKHHELEFDFSMMLPAFRGVDVVAKVKHLCNDRGFVMIDDYQRNPNYQNIYSAGVCIAIPPVDKTPVPTGAPKTGYMIESMVTAIAQNIKANIEGRQAHKTASWNAICLADMGDSGAAFVALPQMPPRNVAWIKKGKWVHAAKIAFEKYFIRKMKKGNTDPLYEKYFLKMLGIEKLG
jgi:sulfide:quinone oxidoreductase